MEYLPSSHDSFQEKQMSGGQLDKQTVQQLMWLDDEEFEETVSNLTMRGLLDLVMGLQNAMAEEQHRFDQLSVQLQMYQDTECEDHKRISTSLCTSQMRLARLCTRNMRCFTQQAIRAKEEPLRPVVTTNNNHHLTTTNNNNNNKMASTKNNPECEQPSFRNSLKFFQTQIGSSNSVENSKVEQLQIVNGKSEDDSDFVVHKAAYGGEPDIPSPDYNSSEEEDYQVHRTDEDDFIDNSCNYDSDPRRYIYYPEDNELEVIPEEDEEFEEMQEMHGVGSRTQDGIDEESTKTTVSQTECDSGVTDDQHSSAAEECDSDEECDKCSLGDTDSAKGSLFPDSISESPTHSEKQLFRSSVDNTLPLPLVSCGSSPDTEHTDIEGFISENLTYRNSNSMMNGETLHNAENSESRIHAQHSTSQDEVTTTSRNNPSFISHVTITCNDDDAKDFRRTRSSTSSWDPTDLLSELYQVEFVQLIPNSSAIYINIEGYLDKLPSGRKKATYWNPWKRRYFQAKDGCLFCFESSQCEKPVMKLNLMGGSIDSLENNMIGIDDKKGHYIVVKCINREIAEEWKRALISQCTEDVSLTYINPVQFPLKSHRDVVIIDLGSCSVRAGILMDQPTLPQLFFPTVCATDKISGKETFGVESLLPNIRQVSNLTFPVLSSAKITKYTFDVDKLTGLLRKVFQELNVNPSEYKVQLCVPRSFSLQTQVIVIKILLEQFGVKAINLTHQAILSLYAYNATSGIVVDIGDRLDILPIIDGYIVESGVTRLPYGGRRIIHHLGHNLAQKHISLVSDVESFLARYILEHSCYIAENYEAEMERFVNDPESVEKSISVEEFFQAECTWDTICLDFGRFQAPEGLFTPDLWGLDNPGLQKLVHLAIKECSMDIRREMARSIYVSGGVSLLPGFTERLQDEVDKLTPPSVTPKVHASPYRYHMAYLGACQLASSKEFEQVCVTLDEWHKTGNSCLKKWHI